MNVLLISLFLYVLGDFDFLDKKNDCPLLCFEKEAFEEIIQLSPATTQFVLEGNLSKLLSSSLFQISQNALLIAEQSGFSDFPEFEKFLDKHQLKISQLPSHVLFVGTSNFKEGVVYFESDLSIEHIIKMIADLPSLNSQLKNTVVEPLQLPQLSGYVIKGGKNAEKVFYLGVLKEKQYFLTTPESWIWFKKGPRLASESPIWKKIPKNREKSILWGFLMLPEEFKKEGFLNSTFLMQIPENELNEMQLAFLFECKNAKRAELAQFQLMALKTLLSKLFFKEDEGLQQALVKSISVQNSHQYVRVQFFLKDQLLIKVVDYLSNHYQNLFELQLPKIPSKK